MCIWAKQSNKPAHYTLLPRKTVDCVQGVTKGAILCFGKSAQCFKQQKKSTAISIFETLAHTLHIIYKYT